MLLVIMAARYCRSTWLLSNFSMTPTEREHQWLYRQIPTAGETAGDFSRKEFHSSQQMLNGI